MLAKTIDIEVIEKEFKLAYDYLKLLEKTANEDSKNPKNNRSYYEGKAMAYRLAMSELNSLYRSIKITQGIINEVKEK